MAQAVEPIAEGPRPDRAAPVGARQKGELEPLAVSAERVQTAERSKEEAVYPGRFMVGYLLIVLFFGALLVAFAVAWSQRSDDGSSTASTWSFFKPTADSEALRTRQIASFVGTRYQTSDGQQLARVIGGPPAVQDAPVSQFVIRDGSSEQTIGAGKAIMYILCAAGTDCALPATAASGADGAARPPRGARARALHDALQRRRSRRRTASRRTLRGSRAAPCCCAASSSRRSSTGRSRRPSPTGKAPSASGITDLEAATIDYLTLSNKFVYEFQQASDGTARMMLNPAPASE